jgi:hypothetical protein
MKEYKFLLKPVFFIFNLLFASWLVIKIEKLSPSDLGKYESFFKNEAKALPPAIDNSKLLLKTLIINYKKGVIDSATFDRQLDVLIKNITKK